MVDIARCAPDDGPAQNFGFPNAAGLMMLFRQGKSFGDGWSWGIFRSNVPLPCCAFNNAQSRKREGKLEGAFHFMLGRNPDEWLNVLKPCHAACSALSATSV